MGIIENLESLEDNFSAVKMVYNSSSRDERTLLNLLDELDRIERYFKSVKSNFLNQQYINSKLKEIKEFITQIEEDLKVFCID